MAALEYVQHLEEEGPGAIAGWAAARAIELRGLRGDRGERPASSGRGPLVVLGGPHGALDASPPWLVEERAWLAEALARGRPVFAVCLGAQMLAHALGAEVLRLPAPEMGWQMLELVDEADRAAVAAAGVPVVQWHEDAFALPRGAACFARSAACPVQGYRAGERVVGVQFHAEWTREIVSALLAASPRVDAAAFVGDPHAWVAPRAHRLLEALLDRWRSAW